MLYEVTISVCGVSLYNNPNICTYKRDGAREKGPKTHKYKIHNKIKHKKHTESQQALIILSYPTLQNELYEVYYALHFTHM